MARLVPALLTVVGCLCLATPAVVAAERWTDGDGRAWDLRPVEIDVDRFLPAPAAMTSGRYLLEVRDARVITWPHDAVAAFESVGSAWGGTRDLMVVEGGLTNAFVHVVSAITASTGLRATTDPSASDRRRLPGVEVVVEKFWWQPRNGSLLTGADNVMRVAVHFRPPGATSPTRALAFDVECPRGGDPWENGMEELLPYFAALFERDDVRSILEGEWEETSAPGPEASAGGPPVELEVARVVDDRGRSITGTLVAQTEDALCLRVGTGERLFVRDTLETLEVRRLVLPSGSTGREWALTPSGESGLVVRQTRSEVEVQLPGGESRVLARSGGVWLGPVDPAPLEGGLCAAVR